MVCSLLILRSQVVSRAECTNVGMFAASMQLDRKVRGMLRLLRHLLPEDSWDMFMLMATHSPNGVCRRCHAFSLRIVGRYSHLVQYAPPHHKAVHVFSVAVLRPTLRVEKPFQPLVASLLLVAMPGAPSSVLAPI